MCHRSHSCHRLQMASCQQCSYMQWNRRSKCLWSPCPGLPSASTMTVHGLLMQQVITPCYHIQVSPKADCSHVIHCRPLILFQGLQASDTLLALTGHLDMLSTAGLRLYDTVSRNSMHELCGLSSANAHYAPFLAHLRRWMQDRATPW